MNGGLAGSLSRGHSAPTPGGTFRPNLTAESFGVNTDAPGTIMLSESQRAAANADALSPSKGLSTKTGGKKKKVSEVEKRIMNR
jgi:hypothetical protein